MRFALRAANPDWRPLIPEWDRISQDLIGQALPSMVFGHTPIAPALSDLAVLIDSEMSKPRGAQAR